MRLARSSILSVLLCLLVAVSGAAFAEPADAGHDPLAIQMLASTSLDVAPPALAVTPVDLLVTSDGMRGYLQAANWRRSTFTSVRVAQTINECDGMVSMVLSPTPRARDVQRSRA